MSSKSGGKVYYSFDEIGQELFGLKPQRRVTKDKQKLESQKEKFLGTCPFCKQPLKYVYGTNVLACDNEKCRGKKITTSNSEGEDNVTYRPFYKIMSEKGLAIGTTIFDEKDG